MTVPYANAARKPYPASISSSQRPRSRSGPGSSPAPIVNQPMASIWKGIHGPTPPVSSADANMVTDPSTYPKPGPSTRPLRTIRKNIGSMPAVPAPIGRSAAPVAASTPSMATAFGPSPDSEIVAATTATSRTRSPANSHGASWACALTCEPVPAKSGQPNPAAPVALTRPSAATERGPRRTALACGCGCGCDGGRRTEASAALMRGPF